MRYQRHTSSRKAPHRKVPRQTAGSLPFLRRLRIEPLEDRRLLAITVDTLLDEADGSIVDGDISLRDAIALAPTGETIDFSVTGTINLSIGTTNSNRHLTINKNLTINGPGANLLTINAFDPTPASNNGDGSRVFYISAPGVANVTISGLTLTGGDTTHGGAIFNYFEDLTVRDCVISGNSASDAGGGINSSGNLQVENSTISGNSAAAGGGIFNGGGLDVTESVISGNSAFAGGGIYSTGYGSVTITNSTISDNSAAGFGVNSKGGGIYLIGFDVTNLTISGSTISGNHADVAGGGIFVTGAFDESCNFTLESSVISGNTAGDRGGGLNLGQVLATVTDTTVSDNEAGLRGGGIYFNSGSSAASIFIGSTITGNTSDYLGGGIAAFGTTLSIGSTTISGNASSGSGLQRGGGLFLQEADVTIAESTISGNQAVDSDNLADDRGGGIYSRFGDLMLSDTTVSGNSADSAAGIWSASASTDGATLWTASIVGSTISNNVATTRGGGIYNRRGPMVIQFSTITENQAPSGEGSGIASRGDDNFTQTKVYSSIVGGNVNSDVDFVLGANNSFQSNGYNLIGTGNALGDFNQPGDQTGVVDPLLGPLAENGGPTLTHAVLPGSPAIEAGDPAAVAGAGTVPLYDQRGGPFTRVFDADGTGGARIDIGAFERQTLPSEYYVVDTLVDENDGNISLGDRSLREVISLAHVSVGAQTITFAPSLTSGGPATIELGRLSQLVISDSLTINGPGASLLTIRAFHPGGPPGSGTRVFYIDDGSATLINVEIVGLTLTGGDVPGNGGAIFTSENVTVTSSRISGNSATSQGGGTYNRDGQLIVTDSTINGNTASYGGGLLVRSGTLTIVGSTISGNQAPHSNGGGIESVFAALNVTNSTISGNISGAGGGILSYFSTANISYSTITGNDGTFAGGGINVTGAGSMTLSHTIVAGNFRGISTRDDIFGAVGAFYSLIGDITGATITDLGGNLVGTFASPMNSLLGSLADNGGPTKTHALLPGSPAIDMGDPAFSPPPTYDQRGTPFVRVFDGDGAGSVRIDIGAFELQPIGPALPGDYNQNGTVDAADYTVWRDTVGATATPFSGADGDGNGTIDQDDYDVWKSNFGNTLPMPASGATLAAPPRGPDALAIAVEDHLPLPLNARGTTDAASNAVQAGEFTSAAAAFSPFANGVPAARQLPSRRAFIASAQNVALWQDDTLLAWLQTQSLKELSEHVVNLDGEVSDTTPRRFEAVASESLDLAFATFATAAR